MNDEHPALPMIRAFEQFRASPYWDVNHYRVGYGSDTITRPDGSVQEVKPGMSVSQDDAERDLQRRVADAHATIKSQIGEGPWNKLGPNGQAALTSVHYNYGHLPWGVQNAATTGEPAKVASSINGLSGDNDGVNANRRQAEANAALGIGGGGGQFGLNGVSSVAPGVNRPNVSGSGTSSANGTSDLLSQLLNRPKNPVPAYLPTDGKTFANSPLEGMIRGIAGQGTYTPPVVAKMQGLGSSLNSLFGGSNNQAGQGAPDQAGSVSPAMPANNAGVQPPQPPAEQSLASPAGGTNSGGIPLPPPRPDDLGTPVADASSGGGLGSMFDSLKGLFGGNAG